MSLEGIAEDNIKELLFYLNNAKLIDKLRILQVDVVIIVIWAFLLVIASFSETFLNVSYGSSFTIIIWIITLIFGGLVTIFLKEQVYLTFRPKFNFINKLFIIILITGIVIAVLFDYLIKINELIFPLYSILFSIYSLDLLSPYYKNHSDVFTKNKKLFLPIFSLLSGLVNSLAVILEKLYPEIMKNILGDQTVGSFESLIFTLFISSMMLYIAWYNHKEINNYINNIDIEE